MKIIGYLLIVLMVFSLSIGKANDIDVNTAQAYYQNKDWFKASKAYEKIVKLNQKDHQSWYRLAISYIELHKPKLALNALAHAAKNPQIPKSLISYNQAKAYLISDQVDLMWESLELAVENGFVDQAIVKQDNIWNEVKNSRAFKNVLMGIDKNKRPCVYDERYQAFDFWLGKWAVYGNREKTGPIFGHNEITKTENGCLVMEQWSGASGTTGTSMNYFDGTLNKWVQHWVSDSGTVINYTGGLNSGSMQLKGEIYYAKKQQSPQIRDFKGTWTLIDTGVVRQFFEESTDGGKSWKVWFDGYYFPINNQGVQQ